MPVSILLTQWLVNCGGQRYSVHLNLAISAPIFCTFTKLVAPLRRIYLGNHQGTFEITQSNYPGIVKMHVEHLREKKWWALFSFSTLVIVVCSLSLFSVYCVCFYSPIPMISPLIYWMGAIYSHIVFAVMYAASIMELSCILSFRQ